MGICKVALENTSEAAPAATAAAAAQYDSGAVWALQADQRRAVKTIDQYSRNETSSCRQRPGESDASPARLCKLLRYGNAVQAGGGGGPAR